MGWGIGGRFKREGTYVYLELILVVVWQKPTQYYKIIILQLEIDLKNTPSREFYSMLCSDLNGKEIQKRGDVCIRIADSPC